MLVFSSQKYLKPTTSHLGIFNDLDQLLPEHVYDHVQVPLVLFLVVDHFLHDLLVAHAGARRGRVRSFVAMSLVEHVHQDLSGNQRRGL